MYVFHDLVFQEMKTNDNDLKKKKTFNLTTTVCSRLGTPSLKCHIIAIPCPQVLTMQYSRFGIPSLETILSWLGLPRHEHMPTSLFSGLKSCIFFCSRLGLPSFEMLLFCNSMPPSLDNSLFKTWLSKSWNYMDYFFVSMFLLEMCWWFLIVWCVLPVNFQCHFIIVGGLHHMQPWQEEGCFTSLCTSSA